MENRPRVARCEAADCFHSRADSCYAPAVEVGEHLHVEGQAHEIAHEHGEEHGPMELHGPGHHAHCLTYQSDSQHTERPEAGQVGGCRVNACHWNDGMLCTAPSIMVVQSDHHADCGTFESRAERRAA